MLSRYMVLAPVLILAGCASTKLETANLLRVPYLSTPIQVDGNLSEACYRDSAPLTAFRVAGDSTAKCPPTKAWLFWNEDGLICSFSCEDASPAWAPPTADEHNVDGQDRSEVFLWTGGKKDLYHCIEVAPGNAVHDYQARFYRKFDDAWAPGGKAEYRASLTPSGYTVEVMLPRTAIEAMGLKLAAGKRFKLGLFRADYDKFSGQPVWITWVDRGRAPADFHVAESFGTAELSHR